MLARENTNAIAKWLFEDIICCWGALNKIVTNNGPLIIKAVTHLAQKYHLNHICISSYNKHANGIVERHHFDIRQALFKAVNSDQSKWSTAAYSVFWSEHVTVRRRMGCSPYYAATGTHPLFPTDILEATYLQPPPNSLLTTTNLIACHVIDLQHQQDNLDRLHNTVLIAHHLATIHYEEEHAAPMQDDNFQQGDLVLMRNTHIEVTHNKKMQP